VQHSNPTAGPPNVAGPKETSPSLPSRRSWSQMSQYRCQPVFWIIQSYLPGVTNIQELKDDLRGHVGMHPMFYSKFGNYTLLHFMFGIAGSSHSVSRPSWMHGSGWHLVAKKCNNNGQERWRSDLEHKLALILKQIGKMKRYSQWWYSTYTIYLTATDLIALQAIWWSLRLDRQDNINGLGLFCLQVLLAQR